jgi:hypothetical protein
LGIIDPSRGKDRGKRNKGKGKREKEEKEQELNFHKRAFYSINGKGMEKRREL